MSKGQLLVFFNYTTMQASAKIVYYGPGLCGKTTNLQSIHAKTDPNSRGEMVSLETEADRTLFFDLLPLEVGTIGGMRVRLQLYTVPGQVFYNTTRKLVLKGVDGIVFVADSQVPALDANLESFENLQRNLQELNQPFDKIPFVFQYNKRDLRNIQTVESLNQQLNPNGFETYEAAALHGLGVFETLKAISKKTLAAVHRRISGEETSGKVVVPQAVSKPTVEVEPPVVTPKAAASPGAPSPPTPEPQPEKPVEPGTGEVKVEFAASPTSSHKPATSDTPSGSVSKIATKSKIDIERELESLRRIATGKNSRPSAPKEVPSAEAITQGLHDRMVRIRLPRHVLNRASHLLMDLKVAAQGNFHRVGDSVKIEIPPGRGGKKTRFSIVFEMEEDDS
jgi:signal recognition particle receptor subunit beta